MQYYAFYFLALTVNFNQSTYHANEDSGIVFVSVNFTNPASFDILIQFENSDINATSKACYKNDLLKFPYVCRR